jgi:hypothetical protein
MAKQLLGIAESAESEAVKLAAVKDALDRAGLSAKTAVEVDVEVKPWEQVLADITGVALISRAEGRTQRGLRRPPTPTEANSPPAPVARMATS